MVHCTNPNVVQLVVRSTRSQSSSLSVHMSCAYCEKNLFGFRAPRCYGGQIKFKDISNDITENADGGSNLCLNNERPE